MARRRLLVDDAVELVGDEGGEPRDIASDERRALVDALDRRSGLDPEDAKVVVVVSVLERCGRVSCLLTLFEGPAPGLENSTL